MSNKHNAARTIAQAAREATATATARAVKIVELCGQHGQQDQATALILSNLSAEDIEAMLKQQAVAKSWEKAIATTTGAH